MAFGSEFIRPDSGPSFDDEVQQLGLTAELLRAAVGNGNMERTRVLGKHHARSAQGYCAWNGTLAKLSSAAEDIGWERRDPLGLPVILNHTTSTLLFVSSGDASTGIRTAKPPKSRNPKGDLARQLAAQNNARSAAPALFEVELPPNDDIPADVLGYTAYVLLVHFSKADRELRYEVSLLDTPSGDSKVLVNGSGRMIAPVYELDESDFDEEDPNNGFGEPGEFMISPKG